MDQSQYNFDNLGQVNEIFACYFDNLGQVNETFAGYFDDLGQVNETFAGYFDDLGQVNETFAGYFDNLAEKSLIFSTSIDSKNVNVQRILHFSVFFQALMALFVSCFEGRLGEYHVHRVGCGWHRPASKTRFLLIFNLRLPHLLSKVL